MVAGNEDFDIVDEMMSMMKAPNIGFAADL
jgi:hypothetical protein